jgi:hypothetical protein
VDSQKFADTEFSEVRVPAQRLSWWRKMFGGSDESQGRIGIKAQARSDGLQLLRAIDATQAQNYAVYFFTRLALQCWRGSKRSVSWAC